MKLDLPTPDKTLPELDKIREELFSLRQDILQITVDPTYQHFSDQLPVLRGFLSGKHSFEEALAAFKIMSTPQPASS